MKLKKSEAIAFFAALGFSKAKGWDEKQLQSRIIQVPEKVTPEVAAEKGVSELYAKLVEAKENVEIVADPEGEGAPAEAKAKKSKADKKAEAKDAKAKKPAKTEKKNGSVEKDAFGCTKGSISAKVNAVLSEDWITEQEVAKQAGVTLDQARGRLYYAAEDKVGLLERRRLIQYRIKPGQKPAKAKTGKSKD